MQQVVDIVARDGAKSPFHRMCISMITHPDSDADTVAVLKAWTARIDPAAIPVSILSNPTTMQRADVRAPPGPRRRHLHRRARRRHPRNLRPHARQGRAVAAQVAEVLEILLDARDIFGPQKFGAHIIVGMGETEHEVLTLVQQLVDLGGHSHLFSFSRSRVRSWTTCRRRRRDQWRRVQLARYLIDYRGVRVEQMSFDAEGRVTGYGLPQAELEDVVNRGIAFRTSGCPGKFRDDVSACDRPYGDSPPSNIASYPFQPNKKDLQKIRRQLKIPVVQG